MFMNFENNAWSRYSRKVFEKIRNPFSAGIFTEEEARERRMHFARGFCQSSNKNQIVLYLLVDESDGMIVDTKFQAFGSLTLLSAGEILCLLIVGKKVSQARRISAEWIEKELRDSNEFPFPEYEKGDLNLIIECLESALDTCKNMDLKEDWTTPIPAMSGEIETYPNWAYLSKEIQKEIIQKVLDQEILPYVKLDGGGIELIDILDSREIIISYQGNCTSCFSAVGTTLASIQQLLQTKIHPSLEVIPQNVSLY